MLVYLHANVFPPIGYIFGKLSCVVNMQWNEGLRYLFGLQNMSNTIFTFKNLYTGAQFTLDWSHRMSLGILNVVGEIVYQVLYPVVSVVIPLSAPLWVAFLYIVVVSSVGLFVLKFFLGLFL